MKTIEQIKAQRDFEYKEAEGMDEVLYKSIMDNTISAGARKVLQNQKELHDSRGELLDWILDEGDFKE